MKGSLYNFNETGFTIILKNFWVVEIKSKTIFELHLEIPFYALNIWAHLNSIWNTIIVGSGK
jgi:hypothetical protein